MFPKTGLYKKYFIINNNNNNNNIPIKFILNLYLICKFLMSL